MQKVVKREERICGSGQTLHCKGVQQQHGRSRLGRHVCSSLSHWHPPTSLVSAHLVPPSSHPEAGEVYAASWLPCSDALIKVGKQADSKHRKRGRLSLEDAQTTHQAAPAPPPLQRIVAPSVDVRRDRCDHFPIHAEKRGRCRLCKTGYTQIACLKCFTKDKKLFLKVPHDKVTCKHLDFLLYIPHVIYKWN